MHRTDVVIIKLRTRKEERGAWKQEEGGSTVGSVAAKSQSVYRLRDAAFALVIAAGM